MKCLSTPINPITFFIFLLQALSSTFANNVKYHFASSFSSLFSSDHSTDVLPFTETGLVGLKFAFNFTLKIRFQGYSFFSATFLFI